MGKKSVFRWVGYVTVIVILFFVEREIEFELGVNRIAQILIFGALVGLVDYLIFRDRGIEKREVRKNG